MRIPLIIAVTAALVGCADSHHWSPHQNASAPLRPTDRIYISTPADGEYGARVYKGSGSNTARIIYNPLSDRSRSVRIGGLAANFEDALAAARDAKQDILIFPTIMHWEDRATEWSMIPDRVEVKIEVVLVSSGEVVSAGLIEGESGLATLGGDHPQDLLPEPAKAFVASLF